MVDFPKRIPLLFLAFATACSSSQGPKAPPPAAPVAPTPTPGVVSRIDPNVIEETDTYVIRRLPKSQYIKVDATHIRVNYQIGWDLAAGRTLTWPRVDPVDRAHVRNMVFEGWGEDEMTGSHPVATSTASARIPAILLPMPLLRFRCPCSARDR